MEVIEIKSSMIRPATLTPRQSLWISVLDLKIVRGKHSPFIYFYKPNGSPHDFFQPQVLKEALSNVLVPFYPAAGRLGRDESGRIEINCNAEGVLFVEAETTVTLNDLDEFVSSPKLEQLVPTVDYSGDLSSYPLILIQITRFKCGGVSLGVNSHHVLVDGPSATHFLTSWCDMARGNPITILPSFDRTIIKSLTPPAPTYHHIEFDPHPSMKITTTAQPESKSIIKIPKELLQNDIQTSGNMIYSTFCTSMALRDQSTGPNDQDTKLTVLIDGRSKLKALPASYFGNATFHASVVVRAGDLMSEPFRNTVERIHTAINQQDEGYMKSALACLENLLMDSEASSYLNNHNIFSCPNLVINKLSRLATHQVDFGWGAPIFMGRATLDEGRLFILPSCETDDDVLTLLVGLETSPMELFQKLVREKPWNED